MKSRRKPAGWSLHTKVTLLGTAILIGVGFAAMIVAEWANPATLGPMGVGDIHAVAHDGANFAAGWSDVVLPAEIDVAWVASVSATAVTTHLLEALAARAGRICIARTQPAMAGVRIAYAQPRRLGVDRFRALLAARARNPGPALVVGVGTALTVDLLDARGVHLGGRIAPSPMLMREALHARASQLPAQGGRYADFGADTVDALASGCEGAALALIDASVAAAATRIGHAPAVLLHGGGGTGLLERMAHAQHVPALVLEGLAQWRRAVTSVAPAR